MTLRGVVCRRAMDVASKAMDVAGGAGLEQRFCDLQGACHQPQQYRQQQRPAGRIALGLEIDG